MRAKVDIDEQGNVTNVDITSSDPPQVFDRVVRNALVKWKCEADGTRYVGTVEVVFRAVDE